MSTSHELLHRVCAVACVGSPVLAVAALVGFLWVVGSAPMAEAATTGGFFVPALAALGSVALLAVGVVGLFLHQEEQLGLLGVVGLVIALVGTLLAAGAQWTYVFVVPHFAEAVPAMVDESSGVLLVGFVLSYAVMSGGWVLFGVATFRTEAFPRWAALLLLVGAVITLLPLPSRTLILSAAVGYLGFRMLNEPMSVPVQHRD